MRSTSSKDPYNEVTDGAVLPGGADRAAQTSGKCLCDSSALTLDSGQRICERPEKWFSTCGSRSLWESTHSFTAVTYEVFCIADIYIMMHKNSIITVM